jgi:threonine/homoserine/homoserine lactone efflux protein
LNPKGALFFLAFLPQFLPTTGSRGSFAFGLGLIFCALTIVIYGTYVAAANGLRSRFNDPRTFVALRTVAGLVFVLLALGAARRALR